MSVSFVSRAIAVWVVLLIVSAIAGSAGAQESVSEADIEALEAEISELQEQLQSNRRARSREAQQLESIEREIAAVREARREASAAIDRLSARQSALRSEITRLEAALEAQAGRIENLLVAAWKSQQQTPLKALLAPDTLVDGQRMARFYRMFNEAQVAELRAFAQTQDTLRASEQALAQRIEEEAAAREELVQQNARLTERRNERAQVISRLESAIDSDEERLAEREAEKAELEALLAEMRERLDAFAFENERGPISDARGQLAWPVDGSLNVGYGERQPGSRLRQEGVLLAAEAGATVRAIYPGRVVFADYLKGYGLLVILDHGQQTLSLYGRNQALLRRVGDWVNAGDPIAEVGDTGGYGQPALYFELRRNGATDNPMTWLAGR